MLMLRGDKTLALRAIRKFKGLLIKSWDNAIDNPKRLSSSTLSDEINFLTDYVELEKMRLNTDVSFSVSYSKSLYDSYPIPSFLIQPLLENALWNGINDTVKSNVVVHFEGDNSNNLLEITIVDDGKGLPSKEDKAGGNYGKRKSFGLQILKERLNLISEKSSCSVSNITDKKKLCF